MVAFHLLLKIHQDASGGLVEPANSQWVALSDLGIPKPTRFFWLLQSCGHLFVALMQQERKN